jgi:hypothetical protein
MSVLLVDAANVVGARPDGWWRDRAGAAKRFVAQLEALPGIQLHERHVEQVVVVLEGAARAGAPERDGGVQVRHATASGDDALAALCRPGVLLVTADRALRERAAAAGADVVGPMVLLALLD